MWDIQWCFFITKYSGSPLFDYLLLFSHQPGAGVGMSCGFESLVLVSIHQKIYFSLQIIFWQNLDQLPTAPEFTFKFGCSPNIKFPKLNEVAERPTPCERQILNMLADMIFVHSRMNFKRIEPSLSTPHNGHPVHMLSRIRTSLI